MADHDKLFDVLEPPPGGLARLRNRLDAEPRSRFTGPWVLAGATATAAIVLASSWWALAPRPPAAPPLSSAGPAYQALVADTSTDEPTDEVVMVWVRAEPLP